MNHSAAATTVLAAMALAWSANAQAPAPAPRPQGYLTPDQVADAVKFLGPPPAPGSGAKAGDVATYQATRALAGTPRWALAARDDAVGASQMMANFSCAVGMTLEPRSAPVLFHLFARLVPDSGLAIGPAKAAFKRPRPPVEQGGGVCLTDEGWQQLKASYSYPSGHSTYGWLTGLVMAQIAPDHATDLLARARSFGESRVICGVHYQSDVQTGRVAAASVFAGLQNAAAFAADVQSAKAELAQLRTHPTAPDATECAIEAKAAAEPIW